MVYQYLRTSAGIKILLSVGYEYDTFATYSFPITLRSSTDVQYMSGCQTRITIKHIFMCYIKINFTVIKCYGVWKMLTQTFSENVMYLWSFFLELHQKQWVFCQRPVRPVRRPRHIYCAKRNASTSQQNPLVWFFL